MKPVPNTGVVGSFCSLCNGTKHSRLQSMPRVILEQVERSLPNDDPCRVPHRKSKHVFSHDAFLRVKYSCINALVLFDWASRPKQERCLYIA